MDKTTVKNKLSNAYERIQSIGIQPTKTNLLIIMDVMTALESAYAFIDNDGNAEEVEKDGE